ncbi:MAG: cytochrome c3 family protein [Phycisphaerales bacterium]|nr:cytochrome c3 family protein [Phycisphaerales bacterium]
MKGPPTSAMRSRPRPALGARVIAISLAAMMALVGGCKKEKESEQPPVEARRTADTAMRYMAPSEPAPPTPHFIAADHPAPRPTEALPEGATCITPECHAVFGAADRLHGPLAAGDCFSCHAADTGGHVYPLVRAGNDTCNFCHQTGNTQLHKHEALDSPGCTGCHDPHAGRKFLLVRETIDQVCSTCHVLEEGKHAHGPFAAGECSACHQPHESNNAHLLRGGSGSEHCFACHADTKYVISNAPYVHEPARQECTTCHAAHTSDFDFHLKQPTEKLCLDCHSGLEEAIAGATTPHAAVFTADSCANCHDPHAAGRPKLLRDRQTTLCLACHDRPVKAEDGRTIPNMTASVTGRRFLHGPVESGDCAACHNVHGSTHTRLLKQEFPSGFYSSFDLQNYALCFSCHSKDLVLAEKTTALTDFRDGDRNLHYLHVNRDEKGRSCKTCHAIHGSDLEQHLATEVPFESSNWMMPLGFERTEDGGKCAPGCHVAMTYHRTPGEDATTGESATPAGPEKESGGQP